ncbi:MAG: sodium/glutamate symporter [Betaproteobacteria bacterium]
MVAVALAIGRILQEALAGAGVRLPDFLTAMFGGIVITDLADVVRRPVDHDVAELISTIALQLFLAMSMVSLELWDLIPFAGQLAAVVIAQVVLIASLAALVLFPLLGRTRDAAIAAAGYFGFSLGAMPVGLGTMRRLQENLGPAPHAVLIVTLAASLFTDTANAVAIQAFFDWLGVGE